MGLCVQRVGVCLCVHVSVRVWVCVSVHLWVCECGVWEGVFVSAGLHVCASMCLCVCVSAGLHVCGSVCMCVCGSEGVW